MHRLVTWSLSANGLSRAHLTFEEMKSRMLDVEPTTPMSRVFLASMASVNISPGTCAKQLLAREQGPDRSLGMLGVQLLYFFIRQICQGCEQLCQVAAHVGVRAIPHCQIRDLGKALQHRCTISTVLELWLAQARDDILQTYSSAHTHVDNFADTVEVDSTRAKQILDSLNHIGGGAGDGGDDSMRLSLGLQAGVDPSSTIATALSAMTKLSLMWMWGQRSAAEPITRFAGTFLAASSAGRVLAYLSSNL
ncbi:MAG: hypothetical protein FRX49_12015 [Trebouxia sp. A1-2]|nr:MAG: hypothetical protein FRX49_12015 [Trebouxia sp. A1-2]